MSIEQDSRAMIQAEVFRRYGIHLDIIYYFRTLSNSYRMPIYKFETSDNKYHVDVFNSDRESGYYFAYAAMTKKYKLLRSLEV